MINIKSLCFSYDGSENYNLNNINLKIPRGHYISVVGENGSYKTTFIKLLVGSLKPSSGSIEKNIKSIGYVPQRSDNFNSEFSITVYEILKIHLKSLKLKDLQEIDRVLDIVHMKEFKNSLIGNLSGGQQQRIFIARALLGSPELLVLDELSTGIDEKTQLEIYELLSSLNQNNNLTIISVEHSKEKALKYSSKIIELSLGNLSFYSKEEYKNKLDLIRREL
ncbi:metal ABC transporter ATP-binding protein [Clostridium massiliamazoniense]|uniref:metal ABC transporter ATP-binding protein n=1 Tax=Clostridium massiliamazoniense TaxID=1347366 RepID=UPI0006D7D039|nr:metal ABC transporter ATP-binding protein [Clostridium massiliamazoniense]